MGNTDGITDVEMLRRRQIFSPCFRREDREHIRGKCEILARRTFREHFESILVLFNPFRPIILGEYSVHNHKVAPMFTPYSGRNKPVSTVSFHTIYLEFYRRKYRSVAAVSTIHPARPNERLCHYPESPTYCALKDRLFEVASANCVRDELSIPSP